MNQILILIQCPDKIGLVAAISGIIAAHNLNIKTMREFVDHNEETFFARIECVGEVADLNSLKTAFENKLGEDAVVQVYPEKHRKKIAILVSKEFHCLSTILVDNYFDQLNADITCVIGNHEVLSYFSEKFSIPFCYIPRENKSRDQFEAELLQTLNKYNPDYIILAKFMQILSGDFVLRYPNKIINIHHSFLPAFAGARPYRQAYERGVKIIGATAHIVTEKLDNGPIIVQETIHINHNFGISQLKTAGHDIEKTVLSRAIRLILEDRVFVSGNKTVIFE